MSSTSSIFTAGVGDSALEVMGMTPGFAYVTAKLRAVPEQDADSMHRAGF